MPDVLARRVRWRRGRPRQDELTTLAAIVDLVPDDIPEVGGQLPLIDEARRRAREEGSGVEGGQIPNLWPGVHANMERATIKTMRPLHIAKLWATT